MRTRGDVVNKGWAQKRREEGKRREEKRSEEKRREETRRDEMRREETRGEEKRREEKRRKGRDGEEWMRIANKRWRGERRMGAEAVVKGERRMW